MSLDELRELLPRHVRPDLTTAIDGVRICKADHAVPPESSMSGTVLAVIAQGGKRLALGDRVYEYGAGQYLVASVDLPVTGHVIDAAPGHPTGMSVSAFHRNFQAVTAMTPIQFQKHIRLQAARLLLANSPNDITGVGNSVGYDSPSQFSREYRRQFGAPPSLDAMRMRGGAGPAAAALP
jgi:hypothetical protein